MVAVLYKYMTVKRVLTCLPEIGDGTLRATQPAALNDPFECGLKTDFIDIGWDEIKRNKEYAEVLNSIPGTGMVTADDVFRAKRRSGSLYLRTCLRRSYLRDSGSFLFPPIPGIH